MALAYDPSTTIGKLRMMIGDTRVPFTFEDAEIEVALEQALNELAGAAALLCEQWAAQLSADYTSTSAGGASMSGDRAANLLRMAERYFERSETVVKSRKDEPYFAIARQDWTDDLEGHNSNRRLEAEDVEAGEDVSQGY